MLRASIRTGLLTGLLAAASTAGAVVGLGIRHDRALEPFVEVGRSVLPAPEGLVPLTWLALTSGLALHVVWMVLWGMVFAIAAGRLSRVAVACAAVSYVALLGLVAWRREPGLLGVLGSAPLSAVQRSLVLLFMAVALFAGVRFAQVPRT